MNILLIGPQGSGKGEQAKRIVQKYNLAFFSAGDFLRDLAKEDSERGRMLNQLVNVEGKLVSDEMMNELVFGELDSKLNGQGVLFDGYPRTLFQFDELVQFLSQKGQKIDKVLYLNISEETSISRLTTRRICPNCKAVYNVVTNPPKVEGICDNCGASLIQRQDETPEAIKNRLATYKEKTAPLIEKARELGVLEEINGEVPIDEVFAQIQERLD